MRKLRITRKAAHSWGLTAGVGILQVLILLRPDRPVWLLLLVIAPILLGAEYTGDWLYLRFHKEPEPPQINQRMK
jgi:hypothetical protein